MQVEVNYFAVLLAAVSSMVIGSIWYAPKVFGNTWKSLVNLDEKKMRKGAPRAMAIAFAGSLITAYILAHVIFLSNHFFHHNYMQDAVTTAFWLWLGLTAVRFIVHDAFEGRPTKLTLLNVANEFVTIMVMGIIIGLFVPAVLPA
jgi:hypothetical protein